MSLSDMFGSFSGTGSTAAPSTNLLDADTSGQFNITPEPSNYSFAGTGIAGMAENFMANRAYDNQNGNILGMSPDKFSAVTGQLGAALAPKGSWQQGVGSLAANMGSQGLQQIANSEAEKRTLEFYKELFKGKNPAEIALIKADLESKNGGVGLPTHLSSTTPALSGMKNFSDAFKNPINVAEPGFLTSQVPNTGGI